MTIRFSDRPYATNLIERWQTGRSHERASHDCQHPNALSSASTSNWYRGAVCRPAGFPLRRRTSGRADEPTVILADSLWISGCPIDYAWLQEQRIDLVVDVADPELRLEPDMLGAIVYCKEALVDGPDLPAATVIDRLVQDVVTAVREGDRVLVACAGGPALASRLRRRRDRNGSGLPAIEVGGRSCPATCQAIPRCSYVLCRPRLSSTARMARGGWAKPRKSLRVIRITKLKTT